MRLFLISLLIGCEWVRLPVSTDRYDLDEDGYDSLQDCNDFNAHVHPFAQEECNGTDNNCSGDESDAIDAIVYYADLDDDGYGDGGSPISACEQPLGSATRPSDCDDTDADVFPGAAELDCSDPVDRNCDGVPPSGDADGDGDLACTDCDDHAATVNAWASEACNGRDDDCNGEIDDGLTGTTWYVDYDEDGWGASEVSVNACDRPRGYAATGGDCDDTDETVHPTASERCDSLDQDCDGEIDEYDRAGNERWYTDADEDGWGSGTWSASCTGVEGSVLESGDCADADATIHPGADEICDDIDQDCDSEVDEDPVDGLTWYSDIDGDGYGRADWTEIACTLPDGYSALDTDCDDSDDAISPAANERCGGGDEDCDGETDEDGAIGGDPWYADADGDTFGDEADVVFACAEVAGRIALGGDCDDGDSDVYPGALEIDCSDPVDYNCDGSTGHSDADADGWDACEDCDDADDTRNPGADETCDGADQDCDGDVDESATDGDTWYPDLDSDSYGDEDAGAVSCSRPSGYIVRGGDCDDGDAAVNPGATETCATSGDDDCDGDTESGVDCSDWYADADGDGFGDPDSTVCRCTEDPAWPASNDQDCLDSDAEVSPAATETCADGLDDDCDGAAPACGIAAELSLADASLVIDGAAAGDGLGSAASTADLDDDGLEDLVVAAAEADDGGVDAGAVYLLATDGTTTTASGAWATWTGAAAGDYAGGALIAGDLDGDGSNELYVGGIGDDDGGSSAGAVWVLDTPAAGGSLAGADKQSGGSAGDNLGAALALLDDVIAAGAPRESSSSGGAGAVYAWEDLRDSPVATLLGGASGDRFGDALASAGDFDGDGATDLVVGGYAADDGATNAGAAWVFAGPLAGTLDTADALATRLGAGSSDSAGYAVAGGGDCDGDGYDDVWVGAFNNDGGGAGAGAAYMIAGGSVGTASLGDSAILWGTTAGDRVGIAIAVGDFDADGTADVAVGGDGGAYGETGVAWVLYGPVVGATDADDVVDRVLGEVRGDGVGLHLTTGALTGNPYADLLVGATTRDSAATDAGAIYLVEGGPGL